MKKDRLLNLFKEMAENGTLFKNNRFPFSTIDYVIIPQKQFIKEMLLNNVKKSIIFDYCCDENEIVKKYIPFKKFSSYLKKLKNKMKKI